MASKKTIINQSSSGLSNITTLDVPATTVDREIVLFSGTDGKKLLGSGVLVSADKNITPVKSVTFGTNIANPGSTTTVWINSADQLLYLGSTPIGGIALSPIGSAPNANAASLTGNTLNLQPASASFGGVMTTGAQNIAGNKTFSGTIAASNLSGTNSGDVTLAAIGATPNANAATLTGQALSLQPASATFGGVLTTGAQTIAGNKTFSGTITASGLSGTNTGDVTLAAIGSTANANGATITGQVLNLQPASASFGGVLTTGAQTIAGNKTFSGTITASGLSGTNSGDVTLAAIGSVPNANGASITGQALTLQPASATFGGVITTGTQTIAGAKTLSNDTTFSSLVVINGTSSATQGSIFAGANRFICRPSTQNTFIGVNAGNFTGTMDNNIGIGVNAMTVIGTSASSGSNIGIGTSALGALASANQNVAMGTFALQSLNGASFNTAIGDSVAMSLVTGSGNCLFGRTSGSAYTTNESNNIVISNAGVIGDSATIRIGSGTHTRCFITGITNNTTLPSTGLAMGINPSTGQLGVEEQYDVPSAVMTLNSGTITQSSIRGVTQGVAGTIAGIRLSRVGRIVQFAYLSLKLPLTQEHLLVLVFLEPV